MIIAYIISFVIGAFAMMCAIGLMSCQNDKKLLNDVHFYVARDKHGKLWLYLNKPIRCDENIWVPCKQGCSLCIGKVFENIGLNESDYEDLKWEDEPVEVFINIGRIEYEKRR